MLFDKNFPLQPYPIFIAKNTHKTNCFYQPTTPRPGQPTGIE